MCINYSLFNYDSFYQLNQSNNKSYISSKISKYKNNRSKIPIKPVHHNYNSISKLKNINNNSINDENNFYKTELKSYELLNNNNNNNYKNSIIRNYKINSFEHLSLDKSKPGMNIMINNGIIKNIIVNKNCKGKIPIKINKVQNKQNHHNNFYNNFNKIKEKLYNDYNRTYLRVNKNNIIIRKYNENLNFNSASKNMKATEFKSFNGKKLLKNNNNNLNSNNNFNKLKQIPLGNNFNNYSQRRNSYGNDINIYNNNLKKNINENYNRKNNIIPNNYNTNGNRNKNINNNMNNNILNQNKKITIYKSNNFFSKTNIYETKNSNLRDNILIFPLNEQIKYNNSSKISKTKIKINNQNINCTPLNKHQSFNKNNLLNTNKLYNYTEDNLYKVNLISSSSSSDYSNELSALAEDIINIQKNNKRKKNDLKEININKKPNNRNQKLIKENINKNLTKDFNTQNEKEKENKKKIEDSTEENFDLIEQIINETNLEEKKKKTRKIIFETEKNEYINYKAKEKVMKNDKKMEYYFTLLKSKIKLNPIIKNFDKNEIKINNNYISNENLEEYEMLGDLYNIFYLKDINDLDNKLKNNIDNLIIK